MTIQIASLILLTLMSSPIEQKKNPTEGRISVYVFSQGADKDGFVEINNRQITDSVNDIKKKIPGKFMELAKDKESADITLEVLDRGKKATDAVETHYNTLFGGAVSTTIKVKTLFAVMRIGDKERGITGSVGEGLFGNPNRIAGAWGEAAGHVADKLESWVKENYDAIITYRAKKASN